MGKEKYWIAVDYGSSFVKPMSLDEFTFHTLVKKRSWLNNYKRYSNFAEGSRLVYLELVDVFEYVPTEYDKHKMEEKKRILKSLKGMEERDAIMKTRSGTYLDPDNLWASYTAATKDSIPVSWYTPATKPNNRPNNSEHWNSGSDSEMGGCAKTK